MKAKRYTYEAMRRGSGEWLPIDEAKLRARLAVDSPDPADVDLILSNMHEGDLADDLEAVFRAVPAVDEAD
jgi:hypothetical protein